MHKWIPLFLAEFSCRWLL